MADESEAIPFTIRVELPHADLPKPTDRELEVGIVHALLDWCVDPGWTLASLPKLTQFGRITPWIALQLGCYAEWAASQGNLGLAERVAWIALQAATESGSASRHFANLLTLAHMTRACGDEALAEDMYRSILANPLPGGQLERGAAHLALGTIFRNRGRAREAVDHFERGLAACRSKLDKDALRRLEGVLTTLYADATDIAGLLHSAARSGHSIEKPLSEWMAAVKHVQPVLALWSRLNQLGAYELADEVRERWLHRHASTAGNYQGGEQP